MKLVAFTCPSCGAHLDVDMDSKTASCQYCGATFPIENESHHFEMNNAEQAGYEFEKGRLRAQAEAAAQAAYTTPKKRKTWLWVLGWIFIFPVPLTILMLRKKNLRPAIRYGVIAFAWLIYLAIAAGGSDDKSSSKTTTVSEPATTQEQVATTESTEPTPAANANVITIKAGEANQYSEERVFNAGTPDEDRMLVYYVPAGTYEVKNTGKNFVQVNVYSRETQITDGWEEPAHTADGTPIRLASGATGTITVPEDYHIKLYEPDEITLTPIG